MEVLVVWFVIQLVLDDFEGSAVVTRLLRVHRREQPDFGVRHFNVELEAVEKTLIGFVQSAKRDKNIR